MKIKHNSARRLAMAASLIFLLAGCDSREADPTNNLSGQMALALPDGTYSDLEENRAGYKGTYIDNTPTLPSGSSTDDGGGVNYTGDNLVMPATCVAGSVYTEYLRAKVADPIKAILSGRNQDIYFSIMFCGWDPVDDAGTQMVESSAYTTSSTGSLSAVGGSAILNGVVSYLGGTQRNQEYLKAQQTTYINNLNALRVSGDTTLMWAVSNYNIPADIRAAMGNPTVNGKTFREYKDLCGGSLAAVANYIPNIHLKVKMSETGETEINLSNTRDLVGPNLYPHISVSDLDAVLSTFNQDTDRDHFVTRYSSNYGLVHVEADGFNRCVVILGTRAGNDAKSLNDLLGEQDAKKVTSIIQSIASYRASDQVIDYVAGMKLVLKGATTSQ